MNGDSCDEARLPRDEEWTPSSAGNAARTDFLLKKERIFVEAKMTRKGLDRREVADQLTIDIARYRQHPDCGTLICFVYDPDGRVRNASSLDDITKGHGDLDVRVIVAPR